MLIPFVRIAAHFLARWFMAVEEVNKDVGVKERLHHSSRNLR